MRAAVTRVQVQLDLNTVKDDFLPLPRLTAETANPVKMANAESSRGNDLLAPDHARFVRKEQLRIGSKAAPAPL
jgi:hypothetical protein